MEHDKICQYCGKHFTAARSDVKYCSSTCRTYASREGKTSGKKNRKANKSLSGIPAVDLTQARIEKPVSIKQVEKPAPKIPVTPQVEKEQELTFAMMPPLRGYVEDVKQVNLAKLPPPPEPPAPFNEERPREIKKKVVSFSVDVPNPRYKELFAAKTQQIAAIKNLTEQMAARENLIKQIKASTNGGMLAYILMGTSGGLIGHAKAENKPVGTALGILFALGLTRVFQLANENKFQQEKKAALEKETGLLTQERKTLAEWNKVLDMINRKFSGESELQKDMRTKVSNSLEIAEQDKRIAAYEQRKDKSHKESIAYSQAVAEYEAKYGSIQAIHDALNNAEEMPQAEVNDSGVISSLGLNKVVGGALLFKGAWRNFFGTPSRDFKLVVHGPSFSGKSHFALKFAHYLALHHGKVLYNTSEEGFSRTMDSKLEKLGAKAQGLDIGNYTTVEELKKKIPRTAYNFIVLDSVSDMNMNAEDLQELRRFYCCSAIIGICQNTKAGEIRGGYDLVHDADIKIRVENGTAFTDKNRFVDDRPELEIFNLIPVPLPPKGESTKPDTPKENRKPIEQAKPEKEFLVPSQNKGKENGNTDLPDASDDFFESFDHVI